MANSKTNDELKKQRELLKELEIGSEAYAKKQEKILELQNKINKATEKENELARKSSSIYQQLQSSIEERKDDIIKINVHSKNLVGWESKSAHLQKEGVKAQARMYQSLTAQVDKSGEMNKVSKQQLTVLDQIKGSSLSIADIQKTIEESKEREGRLFVKNVKLKKDEQSLQKILNSEMKRLQAMDTQKAKLGFIDKLTGGLASKAKEWKEVWQENPKVAGYVALGGIVGLLVAAATKFA